MKTEQCLSGKLREKGIAMGVDVEALDREFQEVGRNHEEAIRIVKKRRGWFKHFWITFCEDFPIPRLGYVNPEVQEGWDRINRETVYKKK